MKIKSSNLLLSIYWVLTFAFSYYIFSYYTLGDQRFYIPFYNDCLSQSNLNVQFICYKETVGAQEPFFFFTAKFFSFFSSKVFFSSFLNSCLIAVIFKLASKNISNNISLNIFMLLIVFNYYILALFFSVERLKLGLLLLLTGFLFKSSKKYILFFLALLSHLQIMAMIICYLMYLTLNSNKAFWKKLLMLSLASGVFIVVFLGMKEQFLFKFNAYYEGTQENDLGLIGVIKTSLYLAIAVLSIKNFQPLIVGFPLIVMSYFLGSDRVAIMAFIIGISYVVFYRKKADLLIYIVLFYSSYKSVGFIQNIFLYGEGWH